MMNTKGTTLPGVAFTLFFLATLVTGVFTVGLQAHHQAVSYNSMMSAKIMGEKLSMGQYFTPATIPNTVSDTIEQAMRELDYYSIPSEADQAVYLVAYVVRDGESLPVWEARVYGQLSGGYFDNFTTLQPGETQEIGGAIRFRSPEYPFNACDICRNQFLK